MRSRRQSATFSSPVPPSFPSACHHSILFVTSYPSIPLFSPPSSILTCQRPSSPAFSFHPSFSSSLFASSSYFHRPLSFLPCSLPFSCSPFPPPSQLSSICSVADSSSATSPAGLQASASRSQQSSSGAGRMSSLSLAGLSVLRRLWLSSRWVCANGDISLAHRAQLVGQIVCSAWEEGRACFPSLTVPAWMTALLQHLAVDLPSSSLPHPSLHALHLPRQ